MAKTLKIWDNYISCIINSYVSNPMKSDNYNGPIGTLSPNLTPLSISSLVAMPSYRVKIASFR